MHFVADVLTTVALIDLRQLGKLQKLGGKLLTHPQYTHIWKQSARMSLKQVKILQTMILQTVIMKFILVHKREKV